MAVARCQLRIIANAPTLHRTTTLDRVRLSFKGIAAVSLIFSACATMLG